VAESGRLRRAEFAVAAFGLTALLLSLVFVLDVVRFHGDVLRGAAIGLPRGHVEPRGLMLLAVAVFDLLALARAAIVLSRGISAHRRLSGGLPVRAQREVAGRSVVVLAGQRPMAFCAGLLRPRIFVSEGAFARLRPDELAAVVAHEAHHAARRDPLRILVARAIGDAFAPVPAGRALSRREQALAELAADAAAVRGSGGAGPLAAALLTFHGEGDGRGDGGIAPERVDRLAGESPLTDVPRALVIGAGAVVVVLLGALGWALALPDHPRFCLPLASAPVWTLCAVTARVLVMTPAWLSIRRVSAFLRPV
jgi:hypothetical protein